MRLVSYAQNREDIVLWRALSHVSPGFYIDVGAHDPVEHSCTKLFYDRGWSGINIEPAADLLDRLRRDRTRDVNLGVGASDHDGEVIFYADQATSGFSTIDPQFIAQLKAQGHHFSEVRVPTRTLRSIVDEHARGKDVHFLKVDVEGHERDVLGGAQFKDFRPWVVIVEAISPTDWSPTHAAWEGILLDAGYELVLFDGLNRFYLARERSELRSKLWYPACVLDDFASYDVLRIIERHDREMQRLRHTHPVELARALQRRIRSWIAERGARSNP